MRIVYTVLNTRTCGAKAPLAVWLCSSISITTHSYNAIATDARIRIPWPHLRSGTDTHAHAYQLSANHRQVCLCARVASSSWTYLYKMVECRVFSVSNRAVCDNIMCIYIYLQYSIYDCVNRHIRDL